MRSDKDFYTYILCDSRKLGEYRYKTRFGYATLPAEPFYVGKGKGRRSEYHTQHILHVCKTHPKSNKIKKMHREGYKVLVIRSKKFYDEPTAFAIERELIEIIGRQNLGKGPLTNLTDGGEGTSGLVTSEDLRETRRQNLLSRLASLTDDEKEELCRSIGKGRRTAWSKMSDADYAEYCAKISNATKRWASSLSPKAVASRVEKMLETRQKFTPVRREAIRQKTSASQKKRYAGKSEAWKEARAEKISEGHRRRPLVSCPHCSLSGKAGGVMTLYHFDNCKKRIS